MAASVNTDAFPTGVHAQVVSYGEDQLDAIENCVIVTEQEVPKDLKDGDLLIEVRATEIVWTDTIMATGQYQHQARVPYAPGMTYAGVVLVSTPAAEKAGFTSGDRVAIAGINAGPRSSGPYQKYGGCATYAVAPHTAVRFVPPSWSFEEAACFAYGYDTAYHCLVECGKVQAGETILILGATGGVGIPAVNIALLLGLTVIATTRSAEKAAFLRSLGVHHVVTETSGDIHKAVRDLTQDGRGVDVVYDGVGGETTIGGIRSLRFRGRLLIVGWAATPNVGQGKGIRGASNPNQVPTNLIMMKGLTVIGCPAMIATRYDSTLQDRRIRALEEWLKQDKLPPLPIGSIFPLQDVKDALKTRVASGSQIGSTIVIPPTIKSSKIHARL